MSMERGLGPNGTLAASKLKGKVSGYTPNGHIAEQVGMGMINRLSRIYAPYHLVEAAWQAREVGRETCHSREGWWQ
jgi:hypothetical protein